MSTAPRTAAGGEPSWLAVALGTARGNTGQQHPARPRQPPRSASPQDASSLGLLMMMCRLLGCGCLRRRRDRGGGVAAGRVAPGGRNYQPEAVTQQPITVGLSCGAVAGGSGVAEPNERSSLLPKGKGLDSNFSTSPELPAPSLPKGFLMMEDLDVNADVCPTCLEIYDCDNPMIMTQCKHHFHLACIYEWLERSQLCPVCSKVMRDVEGHKFLEL